MPACEHKHTGGVYTNHDPCGIRKFLGLSTYPQTFYCWVCWKAFGAAEGAKIREETTAAIKAANVCGFDQAYVGRCRNHRPCAEHSKEKCWYCGGQATRSCTHASSLVCGVPECDEHPHVHRT